jgi:arsenate reductase (thioredoxin)
MQKKQVLILCTGNSCRSIMAEALINSEFDEIISAQSSGVQANGLVNENAKQLLISHGIWKDHYHSKTIDKVLDVAFDLVVTVCDHAKESCPLFPNSIKTIHVGFEDPSGKIFDEYEKTFKLMKDKLLPIIKKELF